MVCRRTWAFLVTFGSRENALATFWCVVLGVACFRRELDVQDCDTPWEPWHWFGLGDRPWLSFFSQFNRVAAVVESKKRGRQVEKQVGNKWGEKWGDKWGETSGERSCGSGRQVGRQTVTRSESQLSTRLVSFRSCEAMPCP